MRLWDTDTGILLKELVGHDGTVTSVAVSVDGTRLLSGSFDRTIKLWEAHTGTLVRTFKNEGEVSSVAFAKDARHILAGGLDKKLTWWDATTGKLLQRWGCIWTP